MIFQNFGFNRQIVKAAVAPAGDPNLKVWLDAGNASSYAGSGTTWSDLSGNGNNLTINGSPTYDATTGSFYFANTTSQYAINNSMSNMSIGTADASIEIWQRYQGPNDDNYFYSFQLGLLKTADVTVGGFLQFYGDNGVNGRAMGGRIGGLGLAYIIPYLGDPSITYTKSTDYNIWRQLVLTREGSSGDCKMYVNGSLYKTISAMYTGDIFESNRLNIGGTNAATWPFGAQPWYGDVAIFKAWNGKVVSSTEVTDSYNAYKTRFGL